MSRIALFAVLLLLFIATSSAQDVIPHHQDRPPGPALSPQEAIAKMTVPEGFSVELVANEPEIVNPVAMTFDERGRIWITESLEYPRKQPGAGRDRVKVLERIVTDGSYGVAAQIEALRDASTDAPTGAGIPLGLEKERL